MVWETALWLSIKDFKNLRPPKIYFPKSFWTLHSVHLRVYSVQLTFIQCTRTGVQVRSTGPTHRSDKHKRRQELCTAVREVELCAAHRAPNTVQCSTV